MVDMSIWYPLFSVALIGGLIAYSLTCLYVLCLLWQKDWKRSAIVVVLLAATFVFLKLSEPLMKENSVWLLVLISIGYIAWVAAMIVCWPTRRNVWFRWALFFPLASGTIGTTAFILSLIIVAWFVPELLIGGFAAG